MKISSSLPLSLTSVRNKKLKFKVALRNYVCAHFFCFCSWIFKVKNNWYIFIVFCVFIIPYMVYILYVYYSIYYCHFWQTSGFMVCRYICLYVWGSSCNILQSGVSSLLRYRYSSQHFVHEYSVFCFPEGVKPTCSHL